MTRDGLVVLTLFLYLTSGCTARRGSPVVNARCTNTQDPCTALFAAYISHELGTSRVAIRIDPEYADAVGVLWHSPVDITDTRGACSAHVAPIFCQSYRLGDYLIHRNPRASARIAEPGETVFNAAYSTGTAEEFMITVAVFDPSNSTAILNLDGVIPDGRDLTRVRELTSSCLLRVRRQKPDDAPGGQLGRLDEQACRAAPSYTRTTPQH